MWMAALRAAYGIAERPDALSRAVADSLDGRVLSRRELAAAVERRLGAAAPPGLRSTWGDHLRGPAYRGLLCFAEGVGSEVRFARPDQWLRPLEPIDGQLALRQACLSYVRSFGPTTPRDFARWLLIPPERAKALFADLGAALEEVRIGRAKAWVEAGSATEPDQEEAPEAAPIVRLVPQYDPYLLNSHPRGDVVSATARSLIKTYGQGRNEGAVGVPLLLVDGQVAGIWRHKRERHAVSLTVDSFDDAAGNEPAIRREAAKIAAYFGMETQLGFAQLARRH